MPGGPKPMERARRFELAREIAARIQRHYHDQVSAIGLYGSLARGLDGPYSDIEMYCVLRGKGIDKCLEWSAGAWKAEVDVQSEDELLKWASEVESDWSLTHGSCTEVLALYDPTGFFPRLRDATFSQPDEVFERAIHDVIVGGLYELIGKLRNARAANDKACQPCLGIDLAKTGAYLVGLANRHLYTTFARLFEESLTLPGCPSGYDSLCRMVMTGKLFDPVQIAEASDNFWLGVERWAQEHEIHIEKDLNALLNHETDEPVSHD